MTHARCPTYYTTLVIGDQRLKITAISHKLQLDIALLQERIITLSAHASANTLVLNTYKEMLDSRRSVLAWLSGYQHPNAHLKSLVH